MIPSLPPAPFEIDRVLDIERRQVARCRVEPSDTSMNCDVLVVGGGLGGVAAAEAAARAGLTVILTEPTRLLGGQLTSQLVPVPDENAHIEKPNGPSTRQWRALRQAVRAHYAARPGVKPGLADNVGQCWVSRVSGTPDVWEKAIRDRLAPFVASGRIRHVLTRHQIRQVGLYSGNGRFNWADLADLDTGRVTRIAARTLIDATEDGAAMALAGMPLRLGQEARADFDEPHAPDVAHPEWVQSFTYCFLMRWSPDGGAAPRTLVPPPPEYDVFQSFGDYTLDYVYRAQGTEPFTVTYKVLEPVNWPVAGTTRRYLPFWTYRRLEAASSFAGGVSPAGDLALINWRGNDFHAESYLDKSLDEQARILERGRAFAQGFVHWLQSACPRDDGRGVGYPEMQLVTGAEQPGVGADGFALHPYIRESRRLRARVTLNENHLLARTPGDRWGEAFPDSVGCALYAIDIHPSQNEPPLLQPALPYHLPLGAFLAESGPANILPGAKNFGATRLALASARMHPTEWLVGEVAGHLAAFCIERRLPDPATVRETPELLAAFQQRLRDAGVTLYWSEILPPEK